MIMATTSTRLRTCGRVAIVCVAALAVAGAVDKVNSARAAAEEAMAYADKADVARDIAYRAAENAIADCNDAEAALLKALADHGTTAEIEARRKRLERAVDASLDAVDRAVNVAACSSECIAAAGTGRLEAARARDAASEREASSAARKAISGRKRAKYHSEKAVAMAEQLKTRWLIPHGLGATGETARHSAR